MAVKGANVDVHDHAELSAIIVEASPNAIVVVSEDGSILRVNSETERLFGYAREELIGKRVEMLVPDLIQPKHPELRAGFFQDPKTRAMGAGRDLYGRRKDRSEVPIEIGLNPMKTEDGMLVLASIIDITERKAYEEKLLISDLMVESSPAAKVLVSEDGTIVRVNVAFERLFGYSRDELAGQPVELLVPDSVRPRHPNLRAGFHRDPNTRAMGAGRDLYGRRKDGTEVPVEIGLNPMKTDQGAFVLASIIDITERVEREGLMQRQRDEILELSTPVMQVWDRILALPIIGTLDSNRAARLTENLLERIAAHEASVVILDISGVPTIDSAVASNLFKTIQGARLMGAESIISGVRPETAQAMVHLGIDIGTIRSRSTLRDALQLALRMVSERRSTAERVAPAADGEAGR